MTQTSKKITGEVIIPVSGSENEIESIPAFQRKIGQASLQNTTGLLEIILSGAIQLNSSDIHFESEQEKVRIRLRIDGILQDLANLSLKVYRPLLSRLKLLSGIKLNISDRPQDGRFSILQEKTQIVSGVLNISSGTLVIEVRSSTLPSEYGESVVLRILNPKSLISIEDLGLHSVLLKIFQREMKKPNGMIIVTGPTGSGKTTTLYAFLKGVQKPEIKIITIEDPIEYHVPGVSQTQVDPAAGYYFASGLRAIVRQDPDVILVGEIRDLETAQIALQAALTGHLVFSTLHTNDAAGTIARLVDLGAEPSSIAAAINLTVAQRLIRRVCPKCAKFEKPTVKVSEKIKEALANISLEAVYPKISSETKIPLAQGCPSCNFTGYRGRIGVFEAFIVDPEMEKFILQSPPSNALKAEAVRKGMITMYQDGLMRVLEGVTTTAELERAVGEE